jgi:hypothetical protein
VSTKLISCGGVFDPDFFGVGLHSASLLDDDRDSLGELGGIASFFGDNLDAAITVIFENNGDADVDKDVGDFLHFPDPTAQDNNNGSRFNVSIFFLTNVCFFYASFHGGLTIV